MKALPTPVVTVRVPCRAHPEAAPPSVLEALRPHLERRGARIILHFGDVRVPASWFLGDLAQALQLSQRRGASLRFCMVSPPMQNLLRITGIADGCPIHETEREARDAFAGEAGADQ